MTHLESTLDALQTARRAQAAVDAHLAAERHKASLETRYLGTLSAYLAVAGRLTCQRQGCGCKAHRELAAVLSAYRAAWSDWRGRDV